MSPKEDPSTRLDVAQVRAKLRDARGPAYWRSLEELAESPRFQELLQREFPQLLPAEGSGLNRRRFLQLMGASLALAGLNGCTVQPEERIVPYVKQPEQLVPGKPLFFATAFPGTSGYAQGVLAESHMGRPTKIEGNPDHPASLGATDLFAQASILDLYDPDRSQSPSQFGHIRSWDAFLQAAGELLQAQRALEGAGLRVLSRPSTSPTLAAQRARFAERFPKARWVTYEPVSRDGARVGRRRAFGRWLEHHYDLSRAEVLLTLDVDLLTQGPACVRYARQFAAARRLAEGRTAMNRLYCVESCPTTTASTADHRLALSPRDIDRFLLALAGSLGVAPTAGGDALEPELQRWVDAIAVDLREHRGASLVAAGDHLGPAQHVLVHAINEALGNVGTTVLFTDPIELDPQDQASALGTLVEELHAGAVDLLVVLGGNPVFDAPADLDFAAAIQKAGGRLRFGTHEDETSEYCHWHLPASHYLEGWSDARAFDGTASILQPLIRPLYTSRTLHEFVEILLGNPSAQSLDLVQSHWRHGYAGSDFEHDWRRWLHDGRIEGSTGEVRPVTLAAGAVAEAVSTLRQAGEAPAGFDLVFRPDPTLFDGTFANNGWLQECPKPITKLTWDNPVLLSPATAERLGVKNEDHVELTAGDRRARMAAWIQPGHPDGAVTVHLGYGRRRAGRVGTGTGFDVYPLRTTAGLWTTPGVTVRKVFGHTRLACTQEHHSMEGRDLVRVGTLAAYEEHPDFARAHEHEGELPSLMPGYEYEGHKWGMALDLTACVGCNACVIACQAENNIAVVGKEEVLNGREMHWIRIDRYFEGDLDGAESLNQPVLCMQCEQAPCEVVCPVGATVHSDEGLNDMIYNRCVGTRYCSNNCPYKVRRFNFYQFSDNETETFKMQRNPDVTVRSRGVMEKCTYCVQRISHAKIEARRENLPIPDGTIVTACQQVCPSQAIVFGDLNDPQAAVVRWKSSPLNYGLLTELGTRPRTTYLAKVRNPNPALEEGRHG